MNNHGMLGIGIGAFIVAALCCAAPALIVLLGSIGLSALMVHLDYVFIPALALFAGIIAFAIYRRRKALACCAPQISHGPEAKSPHTSSPTQGQELPR